jgi:C-terminal processing protease CtpA/Prc
MQQFVATHQTDKLVIDLRNNTGGDSSILQPLINALATDPGFNRSDRLFVITGRLTISSGLLNAISLRQQTHGTFVGEATGGKPNHFGEVGSFRLPNSQLLVTYAKKFFSTVSGDPASLFPDTTIELSSADYFAGRDRVLENILNR